MDTQQPQGEMIKLPLEVIEMYMLYVDRDTLPALCKASDVYAYLCNEKNRVFWKKRVKKDLGIEDKSDDISWKQLWEGITFYLPYDLTKFYFDEDFNLLTEEDLEGENKKLSQDDLNEIKNVIDSHYGDVLSVQNVEKNGTLVVSITHSIAPNLSMEENVEDLFLFYYRIGGQGTEDVLPITNLEDNRQLLFSDEGLDMLNPEYAEMIDFI